MENAGKAPAIKRPRDVFRRLMSEDSSGGWEKTWEVGATPWDLGRPTPIIVHLVETGSLPNGRALVPGCGTGYDVVAMASPDRHVVGLDISKVAVERSIKLFSSLPNAKYFSFLNEDFFTWEPAEKFDHIFDYTFFCAFEPGVRPLWAQRIEKLLKPGGELITLMYPVDDRSGGPPYKVSVSEYEKVLIPLGFKAISFVDNELAVGPRKGMEKLGRWKKSSTFHSNLTHAAKKQAQERFYSVSNCSDLVMDIKEPHDRWEKLWQEGKTLWDLGEATPIVVNLCETGSLPNGRALIPGCGTGYDVVVMANPDRHVVGLDLSKTCIQRSTKMFSSLPNSKHFTFLQEDFFTWEPTEKFDPIVDFNFFCAFKPKVRPLWAKRMQELLKPGGELITLIFPLDDRFGGPPPYQVSVSSYEELLIPLGFEVISIVDNELAVDSRKGTEIVGRWKKKSEN